MTSILYINSLHPGKFNTLLKVVIYIKTVSLAVCQQLINGLVPLGNKPLTDSADYLDEVSSQGDDEFIQSVTVW